MESIQKQTQEILERIFLENQSETTLNSYFEELLGLGWNEDKIILMMEIMAVELAKDSDNLDVIIGLICNSPYTKK